MIHQQERLAKIKQSSRVFEKIVTLLMVLLPTTALLAWSLLDLNALDIGFRHEDVGPLTTIERWSGAALSLIPISVMLIALYNLRKLFGLYASGMVFEPENVRCFRNMGWTLIVIAPVNILFSSTLSVLLSFDRAVGERMLEITVSNGHIGISIIGAVIVIISWVMAEAVDLSRDNASIV